MCDVAGMEAWSYDPMERPITDQRTTNGVTKTTSYYKASGVPGYNFDGSIAMITYPSGRTVTYTPSGAARMLSAVDTTNNINYAGSATSPALYTASGALHSLTNGTTLVTNYFSPRLQPCRFAVNTSGTAPGSCADTTNKGNVMDFTYNFGLGADNGNVLGITNNRVGASGRSLTAAYDALNRIESASTSTWSEQYGIDLWGNLTTITGTGGGENLSQGATTQNRFAAMSYDAAGNLYNDGSTAYTFDAENRISTAGTTTYLYDGDGKRVAKSAGGVYKIYWYGMGSDPLDETDGTGSITTAGFNEYVFFNGKRIARRDSASNVFYYFTDHLGTSREIVQSGQTLPCYDADFYPFGRESTVYTNTCPQSYKFTGKERDETSLDNFGARYYTSQYGRFMTPDWSPFPGPVPYANMHDPQTLNLYAYVRNNPLSKDDPDGHCEFCEKLKNWFNYGYWVTNANLNSALASDAARARQAMHDQGVLIHGQSSDDALKGKNNQEVVDTFKRFQDAQSMGLVPNLPLPLPPGMNQAEFGQNVMKWGTGDDAARARMQTLTREELERSGVTKEMAETWRDFYKEIARSNPGNPSAAGRADLMQKAIDLLSGK
jgi:RHS repeat-associated protein